MEQDTRAFFLERWAELRDRLRRTSARLQAEAETAQRETAMRLEVEMANGLEEASEAV
jgi:hypothetical protein